MNPNESKALYRQVETIPGWFDAGMAALFAFLDEVQRRAGVVGNGFEIGVLHGRSAAFLGSLLDAERESFGVCDIFEDQELNVSGSTRGSSLAAFQRNMSRFKFGEEFLKIHRKASHLLNADEIGAPVRLFHVDGGHLALEALADLRMAASSLGPLGAIVLDDVFRHDWPGVTEGAIAFLQERRDFVPLLTGVNKLVVVREEAADLYRREMARGGLFFLYFPVDPRREETVFLKNELCGKKVVSLITRSRPRAQGKLKSHFLSIRRALF